MPTFSRRTLRLYLGYSYLMDTILSNTSQTLAQSAVGGAFTNVTTFADLSLSGQNLYENATIRHYGTGAASGQVYDYRVSSFNVGLGAFVTSQVIQGTVNINDQFTVNSRLPPVQKDLALDDAIKKIRVRQEVGISSGTGGADFFTLEGAASPHYISTVLDAYYFADPSGSQHRGRGTFSDFRIVTTATGREIRIGGGLGGSQQLVLDAILELTLGASDFATVNIPDDRWVLSGAAAAGFGMLIMQSPGQSSGALKERRAEWASEFSRLSSRFAPDYSRRIRFGTPDE